MAKSCLITRIPGLNELDIVSVLLSLRVGYPEGGVRVATRYFADLRGLLLAMVMMAGGWDGDKGPHLPSGLRVSVKGFR